MLRRESGEGNRNSRKTRRGSVAERRGLKSRSASKRRRCENGGAEERRQKRKADFEERQTIEALSECARLQQCFALHALTPVRGPADPRESEIPGGALA